MKRCLTIPAILLSTMCSFAQSSGAVEHYYFTKSQGSEALYTPIAKITSANNWYGEARYNYDEINTLSVYGGRTFKSDGTFSWEATPLVGGLMGKMTGGSLGMNMGMDFMGLFFSSQSQYSFSFENRSEKYFFHWTELGYEATSWLYAGLAVQQTNIYRTLGKVEPGCMVGFSIKNWSIPVYAFNTSPDERYYVLGINWQWQSRKKTNTDNGVLLAESNYKHE